MLASAAKLGAAETAVAASLAVNGKEKHVRTWQVPKLPIRTHC